MSLTITEETEYKELARKANNNEYLSDTQLRRLDALDEKKRHYGSSSLTYVGKAKVSRIRSSSSSSSSSSDDSSRSSSSSFGSSFDFGSSSSSSDDSSSSSSWGSSDSGSSFDGGGSSSDW